MKKNKFMKLASGLLVLCLMTTCVIGATLAKYVTAKDVQDSARVAKWGVRINAVANSAFKTEYAKSALDSTVTVRSSDSKKVVAPGTSGTATEIAVTGAPEVAVRLSFAMTVDQYVFLAAGTYENTDGATVELTGEYNPVVFTFKKDGVAVSGMEKVTLATLTTALAGYHVDYPVGTIPANAYTLSWEWAFETGDSPEDKAKNNKADSILGDLAAGVLTGIDSGKYSTEVSYNLTITATQID